MLRKQCYGEHELSARAQMHCACNELILICDWLKLSTHPPTHRQYALKRGEMINSRT